MGLNLQQSIKELVGSNSIYGTDVPPEGVNASDTTSTQQQASAVQDDVNSQIADIQKKYDVIIAARNQMPFTPSSRYITQEEASPGGNYEVVKSGPFGLPTMASSGMRMPQNLMNKKTAELNDYYTKVFAKPEKPTTPWSYTQNPLAGIMNPKIATSAYKYITDEVNRLSNMAISQVGNDKDAVNSWLSLNKDWQNIQNFASTVEGSVKGMQDFMKNYEEKAKTDGYFASDEAKSIFQELVNGDVSINSPDDLIALGNKVHSLELIDNKDKAITEISKRFGNKMVKRENVTPGDSSYIQINGTQALNSQYFNVIKEKVGNTEKDVLKPTDEFEKLVDEQWDYYKDKLKFGSNYDREKFGNDIWASLDIGDESSVQKSKNYQYSGGSGRKDDETYITINNRTKNQYMPEWLILRQGGSPKHIVYSDRIDFSARPKGKMVLGNPIGYELGIWEEGSPRQLQEFNFTQDPELVSIVRFDSDQEGYPAGAEFGPNITYPGDMILDYRGKQAWAIVKGKVQVKRIVDERFQGYDEVYKTIMVPAENVSSFVDNNFRMSDEMRNEYNDIMFKSEQEKISRTAKFNSADYTKPGEQRPAQEQTPVVGRIGRVPAK